MRSIPVFDSDCHVDEDHDAIAAGIWHFGAGKILGVRIGDVPVEEVLFFLTTNTLVAGGTILLATDKCGLRPLHVWHGAGMLAIASHLRTLEELPFVPKRPNIRALTQRAAIHASERGQGLRDDARNGLSRVQRAVGILEHHLKIAPGAA